jgi:uncharacterized membrane protein HdeD (DUF308 family)
MSESASIPAPGATPDHEHLQRVWLQLIVLGAISVVVGLIALSCTFVATMASMMVIGILLVVAGITEVLHAILVRNWRGFALHLLAAGMYLFVGVFMLEDPIRAAAVITLVIAASFLVGGILRVVFAVVERFPSWGWVLLSGLVDLLLFSMIFNNWPESSLWVVGLFIGIDLLFHGWSSIVLGLAVRP